MTKMTVKTAAKINLALDVTGKLPDGYHTIESVFQTVGIYDTVSVELTDRDEITIECSTPGVPCDDRNLAYRAVQLFCKFNGLKNLGCHIKIEKNIPSQAGMGGGSSDGAAVFYILNRLTEKNHSPEYMRLYTMKLGADVPFFLIGGTAYVSGIGQNIQPIADYSGKIFVIAKGKDGVSTAEAYKNIDMLENPFHPDTNSLVNAINSGAADEYKYFGNIFEEAINLESVDIIKQSMTQKGALSSVMTGSGSAVFGLFRDYKTAEDCAVYLKEMGYFAEVCESVNQSFIEIK